MECILPLITCMRTAFNTLLFALISLTILGACSNSKHSDGPGSNPSPEVPSSQMTGTGDSGGGNTYKGRPLESYITDMTGLPAYKKRIAPILSQLLGTGRSQENIQLQHNDLGRMFQSMLKKSWYMIPGKLETLPKERIGSAVPTDQAALQTFKDVWVNSEIFNSMNEEDQARLILHEVLMGLRILKFDSSYAQCLAFAPKREYCENTSQERSGTLNQLTDQDYEDIRSAGVTILQSYQNLTYADWEELMAQKHFNLTTRNFSFKEDKLQLAPRQILKNLETSMLTGALPTHGFKRLSDARNVSTENCSIFFEGLNNQNEFKMKLQSASENFQFDVKLSQEMPLFSDRENLGQKSYRKVSVMNTLKQEVKKGDRSFDIYFLFDMNDLAGVEIREMVCVDTQKTSDGQTFCSEMRNPQNGKHYLCLQDSEVQF